jgi:eukaryotic-like serine/threonine-protein kinase
MSKDAQALGIVEAALALDDPTARIAFIADACGDDAALRERVEELLSRDGDEFRLMPTESFVRPLSIIDSIPDRIGPYRVTGEIARGGMGAVVKAERDDGVFAQTVAIKLIRSDLASPRAQARFAEERRILARLSHPGIVRILDGGEAEGRPWLAMDYIDGVPITEALRARGADRRARLDALEAVGEALAYAHRNLVVHADIKPSNVLMTADGTVHLLDFGIARLIVELDADESGDPYPLTKGYAAPERGVGVAPTIASDVFSLGVLMLAMLECETPGAGSTFVPGTRMPVGALDGDLAAIAAKALSERPDDRYPDVAAFLSDIRRHREFVPVRARTDAGWRYVTWRFVWRHRRRLTLASLAALALVATTAISTVSYFRAEHARGEADARFFEVRKLARFMLTELSDDLNDAPGTVLARARLAEMAQQYLGRLAAVPDAPADLRLDTAQGYRRLASLQGLSGTASLGHPDQAAKSLDRAKSLLRDLLRAEPDHPAALEEMGWIAAGRWTLAADTAAARPLNTQAADYFKRALAHDGARQGAVIGLLATEKNRAYDLTWSENRPADAVPVLRAALTRLRSLALDGSYRREARLLEVNLLNRLGDAIYYAGDKPGALAPYREGEAIIQSELAHRMSVVWIDKLGEAKFSISGTLGDMGGHGEAALAEAQDGIAALKRVLVFGPDANIEKRLLILLAQQGLVLSDLGRMSEAVEASTASIALRRDRLARALNDPARNRDLAVALPNHAQVLANAGLKQRACSEARAGVRQWEAIRASGNLGERDAAKDVPAAAQMAARLCSN